MADCCSNRCACCGTDLRKAPRYVLDFRACGRCLRRHDATGTAAPLDLPHAQELQPRRRSKGAPPHVCHLCQQPNSEPEFGAIACELCEECHHSMPPQDVYRCFTTNLTRLSTGNDAASQPMCDGCTCPTGPTAFLLPCLTCSTCAAQPGLLRGVVRRLPCSVLPDKRPLKPDDIFRRIPLRLLNVPPQQVRCTACCANISGPTVNVINYVLCGKCQRVPPQEVWYHFKGMFIRVMADFTPAHAQQYLHTQPEQTQLGAGGYGTVYKVIGKCNKREYAQKEVKIDRSNMKEAKKEAIMLLGCCHPNIVECSEAFYNQEEAKLFILLEFTRRGDLFRDIRARQHSKQMHSEVVVWGLLRQMASGLAYLHARGIVHRDLKPNNVLIFEEPGGRVTTKITDFGLARALSEPTGPRTRSSIQHTVMAGKTHACGTPFYMAPEIVKAMLRNEETWPTPASDIWALGVILWEITYLNHPFLTNSKEWFQVDYTLVPRQPRVSPARSAELQALISAMLAPTPEARPVIEDVLDRARKAAPPRR